MSNCPNCGGPTRLADRCSRCLNNASQDWRTSDEISFVRSRSESGRVVAGEFLSSREFLGRYLAGARLRTDWGDLDRDAIMGAVQSMLDAKEAR